MAKSNRLRLSEIRAAFRLVGEARDLGSDPCAWRTHVLVTVRKLVAGSVAMSLDLRDFVPGRVPQWVAPVDLGWETDLERRLFLTYVTSDLPAVDPAAVGWSCRMQGRRFSTAVRREVLDDQAWYGSPIVSEGRRSSRIDDNLISCYALNRTGRVHGFQFYRPWGAPPFSIRDRNLLRLVHVELLKLMRDDEEEPLPPRLSAVLRAVLRGLASKQIAVELGLSVFTVDGYIKELYRFFGVGSRAQLLAKQLATHQRRGLVLPEEL